MVFIFSSFAYHSIQSSHACSLRHFFHFIIPIGFHTRGEQSLAAGHAGTGGLRACQSHTSKIATTRWKYAHKTKPRPQGSCKLHMPAERKYHARVGRSSVEKRWKQ